MKSRHVRYLMCSGTAAIAVLMTSTSALAQTTTAQSAMIALEIIGEDFVIDGTETFRFDNTAAAGFYTNEVTADPPQFVNCTPTPRCRPPLIIPDPPNPLPASETELSAVVSADKCTFFNGGKLSSSTYTQEVTKRVGSPPNHQDFKFSYLYVINPTDNHVQKETAWILESSTSEAPLVTLEGFIAGQSTQLQPAKKNSPERFKTSHSILNQQGNPRVSDLEASLAFTPDDGGDPQLDGFPLDLGEIQIGADFRYKRTVGAANGPTGQLVDLPDQSPAGGPIDGWLVSEIQTGVSDGTVVLSNNSLHQDNFLGNDTVNGERVFIVPADLELAEPGAYALTVSGVVKGVQGAKDFSFSATESIDVDAEECTP